MQGMNKQKIFIIAVVLTVLAGSLGCDSEPDKYEVINAFLSEYEAKRQKSRFRKVDSIAIYHKVNLYPYIKLRSSVSMTTFSSRGMSYYSIPEELKSGQSDEEFMENLISQEDITAWNRAMRRMNRDSTEKYWDPAKINKYKILEETPYYMELDFMPVDIPKGGFPIDEILTVSEPVFNHSGDKVLLDVWIHSGPQVVSASLYFMYNTEAHGWKILFGTTFLTS